MSIRWVLVALLLVVAGCGQGVAESGNAMPGDFVGEISYRNGSVAPPYHYEWRVEFDTLTARLEWTPGYQGTETWTEAVDLGADERARFYDRLRRTGLFEFTETDDGLVGGATGNATFGHAPDVLHDSGTLGTSEAGGRLLDEVVAATEGVFPERVWRDMAARQRTWEEQHPK
ncbi:MAG: hypothetical protein WBA97_37235 [Actinophytocola sp.]|uniref:hypothetical protein n=1 Tax=Actinophytocola sp. TaxID=1872138 RepID=UPI003C760FF7